MTRLSICLILVLSAAIATSAQQGSGSDCSRQVSVTSEADLSPVAACSAFSGSITISGVGINALSWPALKTLTGSIQVSSNPHLTTLSLDNLETSSGAITLFNNTVLSAIHLPKVHALHSLEIVTAPNLRQLELPKVQTLTSLKVEDTGLDNSGALPWSSLSQASDLGISNNKFLKAIDLPILNSISGHLIIAANGLQEGQGQGASLLLSNLTTCSNCTFRHLTSLELPSLTAVGSSLSLDETNLQSIQAPVLKTVGQTLSIVSNNLLSNISFAELTSIGGALLIANNTQLTTVDGFRKLKDISGVLSIRGALSNVSFPAVSTVQGGMSILSSSKDFDCSTLAKVKASARGKTVCQAMVKSAKPTNADGTELDSSASDLLALSTSLAAVAVLAGVSLFF